MTMHTWLYSKSASQAIQGDSKGANSIKQLIFFLF